MLLCIGEIDLLNKIFLNLEVNSFIYDESVSKEVCGHFFWDMNDSVPYDEKAIRTKPMFSKVKQAFSRLISPLL